MSRAFSTFSKGSRAPETPRNFISSSRKPPLMSSWTGASASRHPPCTVLTLLPVPARSQPRVPCRQCVCAAHRSFMKAGTRGLLCTKNVISMSNTGTDIQKKKVKIFAFLASRLFQMLFSPHATLGSTTSSGSFSHSVQASARVSRLPRALLSPHPQG